MDKCYITIIQLHEQYMFQSDFKIKPYSEKYFHIKKRNGMCVVHYLLFLNIYPKSKRLYLEGGGGMMEIYIFI